MSNLSAVTRIALAAIGSLGVLVSHPQVAAAQAPASATPWTMRFTSGALVPTGKQGNVIANAQLSAAQLSWMIRPSLAITGTFGWARSRDVASVNTPKLDVFTSDLGIEACRTQWVSGRTSFTSFLGLGAGARSYNYRKLDVDATHNLAAYGAVGGELGVGRVGLRLEARNYVTGFKPLIAAGTSDRRNDVVITAALSYRRQRAAQD